MSENEDITVQVVTRKMYIGAHGSEHYTETAAAESLVRERLADLAERADVFELRHCSAEVADFIIRYRAQIQLFFRRIDRIEQREKTATQTDT